MLVDTGIKSPVEYLAGMVGRSVPNESSVAKDTVIVVKPMPSVPYRISKVTAVIVLVAWALACLLFAKPGFVFVLIVALWATWTLSGIGLVCGLVGARTGERRWRSSAFAFLHALLLAGTGLIVLSFAWY